MIIKTVDVYRSDTYSTNFSDYTYLTTIPVYIGEPSYTFSQIQSYFSGLNRATNFTDRPPVGTQAVLNTNWDTLSDYMGFPSNQAIFQTVVDTTIINSYLVNPIPIGYSGIDTTNINNNSVFLFTTDNNDYAITAYFQYVSGNYYKMFSWSTNHKIINKNTSTAYNISSGFFPFISGGYIETNPSVQAVCAPIMCKTVDDIYVGINLRIITNNPAADANNSQYLNIYSAPDTYINAFFEALPTYVPPVPVDDPYANAGETEEGGGSGSFDYTGDTIPEPSLPTVGAASTGFISLFNPSAAQLQSLMDYLWSPLFDLDTIKRLYADPMQQFVGLSLVPVPVPSSGTKTIQVGGVSTGIVLTAASAQFVSVDCGSITFNSSSLTASYLDFLPYTKTQLYLPYIGIVDVSTDDIMDKTMSIKYHVDILTGGCIAYIIVDGSVMYQYSGQCAINIPLSSIDWSTTISSALNLVSSAIGGIISGASVPLTGGAGVLVGAQGVANMGASAVNSAVSMKPTINKSGAIGGSSGIMAVQKPYLIVTCPNLAHASNQDHYTGYPSFITKSIENCNGYCSFEKVYLSGLGLTDEEMLELENILSEGVYL